MCIFFMACTPTEKEISHDAAIPDAEALEGEALSSKDREKLSKAKGKEVFIINLNDLEQKLKTQAPGKFLCYFWELSEESPEDPFAGVMELSKELAPEQMKILLINVDASNKKNEVNTFIRASGIAADVFQLEIHHGEMDLFMQQDIPKDRPAYFIYQAEEKTGVWYEQKMSGDELKVLIQPFIM